jgi:hypothetical protein
MRSLIENSSKWNVNRNKHVFDERDYVVRAPTSPSEKSKKNISSNGVKFLSKKNQLVARRLWVGAKTGS